MDILMACSEFAPIAKVGALADAVAALAKTLCQFEHRVTVALPRYRCVEESGLMLARRLAPLRLSVGDRALEATLFDGKLGSGVELVFIDLPGLYDRAGIYGEGGRGYPDNAQRFGLYCRAVAKLVHKRAQEGRPFDAVHAHDWPAALLPYLLRSRGVRTVLTVHDAGHQGQFPKEAVAAIGLDWSDFHPAGLEFYGDLNLLKAGVLAADVVTTISPSYAEHIRTVAGGAGLDAVFRARGEELVGIPGGLDYAVWSPSVDPHLSTHFDAEDSSGKGRCKAALLHELELSVALERPLAVSLGPVERARGSDLVAQCIEGMVRAGAQVVVAGRGDPGLEAQLERAAADEGGDARYLRDAGERLTHRLLAAADLLVVAHRFQPGADIELCGQRYGALPVAHGAGSLRDTIVDCDAQCHTGTGFLFEEHSPAGLLGAFTRAVTAMRSNHFLKLRRRVMRLDVSWERPARRYAKLYQAAART